MTFLFSEWRISTNMEQGMLFRMTSMKISIVLENLEIYFFLSLIKNSISNMY